MKELVGRFKEGESGIALVQLALLAVVIMMFTAFAVDLGWFFLNANKIQRAADNAALAGVVYMPDLAPFAIDRAERIAEANGYIDGDDGAALTVVPQPDGKKNQLEVTVTDTVETFFLKVIGRDTQEISRTGRAEYVKPLRMGSPQSQFGNDGQDGIDCSSAGGDPCFWANIHGTFTNNQMGDAFSSACEYGTGFGGGAPCVGSQYQRTSRGYVYAVEHGGGAFSVQVQNGAFERFDGDGNVVRSGDNYEWCLTACPAGPTTVFRVFRPDPTPLTLEPSGKICEFEFAPVDSIANLPGYDPATDVDYDWTTICSVATPEPGLYTVEVEVIDDALSSGDDAGLNRYALRATGGVKLSALGDMSIFNNIAGTTEFFLAQVEDVYAGRTFVVELYDPGDAGGLSNVIKLLGPSGTTWTGGCTITKREHQTADFTAFSSIAPGNDCEIDATRPTNDFNGDWLRIEVDLPEAYSCVGCWWKIRYEYIGTTTDTTTWRAYIAGSPVRLVLGG